jgi:hypothetical protein
MRRAGVSRVCVGIESLDEEVFRRIGKGERLAEVLGGVRHLQRAGIEVQGLMIVGLPGATEATERECVRRARGLGIRASWLNAMAFPGTPLHRWAAEHGRILDDRCVSRASHWSPAHEISFETDDFSVEARRRAFVLANLGTGNFEFIAHGRRIPARLLRGLFHTIRHRPSRLPAFAAWCARAFWRGTATRLLLEARGAMSGREALVTDAGSRRVSRVADGPGALRRGLRAARDEVRLRRLRAIEGTSPVACAPDASAGLHTMVPHRHVHLYLLALKSFLRFHGGVAVVAHDDGTLEDRDRALLHEHVEGIRIVGAAEADGRVRELLRAHPSCRRYREEVLTGKQLFDFFLLAEHSRVISIDSDVLFLRRPDQVVAWIEEERRESLCFVEPTPGTLSRFLAETGQISHHVPMGLALVCLHRELLDLELLERLIPRIRTYDWWTTQNIYPVLIHSAAARHGIAFLDAATYQDPSRFRGDDPVFRHYWTTQGVSSTYASDARRVISALRG